MSDAPAVYHYDPVTGEFAGTSIADADPLDEGRWTIPNSATLVAPGEPGQGRAAVFENGAWRFVADRRGEAWWDAEGNAVIVDFLGDPAAKGLADEEPAPVISAGMVNAERDRRIHAGFTFMGKTYAFDPDSKARVTGAATLAGFAMIGGKQPGDLYWQDGEEPFRFIANDNSMTEMDAQTCFAFGQAAAVHEAAHIFAGRAIKDMSPIPADFATNESYWP